MWLEAIITHQDLVQALQEFLPVKIYLEKEGDEVNPDRWLLLQPATQVELVVDEGLRLTCPAEVCWSVAGVSPTMKIDELRVLLSPKIAEKNSGNVLEFHFKVEESDFHVLPGFIDGAIARSVTTALAGQKLQWNFTETLTRTFALGKTFDPVEKLRLEVLWGKLRVGADALALAVSFKLGFARTD